MFFSMTHGFIAFFETSVIFVNETGILDSTMLFYKNLFHHYFPRFGIAHRAPRPTPGVLPVNFNWDICPGGVWPNHPESSKFPQSTFPCHWRNSWYDFLKDGGIYQTAQAQEGRFPFLHPRTFFRCAYLIMTDHVPTWDSGAARRAEQATLRYYLLELNRTPLSLPEYIAYSEHRETLLSRDAAFEFSIRNRCCR